MRGNILQMELSRWRTNQSISLYQYDYGQKLLFTGVELPDAYEVHFANDRSGNSKTMIGNENGVDIPDEYLLTGEPVYVWLYLHADDTDGETEFSGVINVIKRTKPTSEEPTPVQHDAIDQAIAALNAAVTKTEQEADRAESLVDSVPETVNTALQEAKDSGEFDGPKGDKGDTGDTGNGISSAVLNNDYTLTLNFTNGTSYTTEPIRGAQGEQGIQGETGPQGFAPSITSAPISGGNRLTIHNESGNVLVDIMNGTKGNTGDTGNGIQTITLNGDYTLTIRYTNGDSYTTSPIRGERGERGEQGLQGEQGERGVQGDPGFSPTVSVSSITGGHNVSITDSTSTKSFDVMDGVQGPQGPTGESGVYVGTSEPSDPDVNVWINPIGDPTYEPVMDVKVNNTSVVNDGIANITMLQPTTIIDDTAGSGDTSKVWSADKSSSLLSVKADKTDTVLNTTLSIGRKSGTTVGTNSVATGNNVEASGDYSHAEGMGSQATQFAAHAEGSGARAAGSYSHAEGGGTTASGAGAHAEGSGTYASGAGAHAEGGGTTASGEKAHAEGGGTQARGVGAHSEGGGTIAAGPNSHAEGAGTQAMGNEAHTEGSGTYASGINAHAEGAGTTAAGSNSHVGGAYNVEDSYANWQEWVANTSYATGDKVKITTIVDDVTTVQGYICKTANSDAEFTASKWNSQYGQMNYAEIIGNGYYDNGTVVCSNARALDWDGNEYLKGDLYLNCDSQSKNGTSVLSAINSKQDAPATAGTSGQVLGLNSNLDPVWFTPSGGGGIVDDDFSDSSTNPVQNKVITKVVESVTEKNVSPNLYDKSTCNPQDKKVYNNSHQYASNNSYAVTGKIPVEPSTQYIFYAGENVNIKYVTEWSGTDGSTFVKETNISGSAFTTGANTTFLDFEIFARSHTTDEYNAAINAAMLVKGSVVPSEYEPYGKVTYTIPTDALNDAEALEGAKNYTVNRSLINLYDKSLAVDNKVFNTNKLVDNTMYAFSGLIPVEPNTQYCFSIQKGLEYGYISAWYQRWDSSKVFIDEVQGNQSTNFLNQIHTTANTAYVSFCIYFGDSHTTEAFNTAIDTLMVVEGCQQPAEYVPYNLEPVMNHLKMDTMYRDNADRFKGKKWLVTGTSVSYQDSKYYTEGVAEGEVVRGYIGNIARRKPMLITNVAVSGSTLAGSDTNALINRYQNLNMGSYDFITIEYGINDFGNNVPVGTASDAAGTESFAACLKTIIEYALNQNPIVGLIICTDPDVRGTNVNQNGNTLKDYADVMLEIAKQYRLPVCDWFYHSGINSITKGDGSSRYFLTQSGTHPSVYGHMRMGAMLNQVFDGLLC